MMMNKMKGERIEQKKILLKGALGLKFNLTNRTADKSPVCVQLSMVEGD